MPSGQGWANCLQFAKIVSLIVSTLMKLEMRWLALQELSVAQLADELSVAHLHFAADSNRSRSAFKVPTFEGAVVDVHLLRLGRDLASVIGIIDHEIGIASQCDGALAREEAEQLCGLRATGVDESVQIDSPALDPVRVHQIHAIFDAGDPVWNFGEIAAAHFLLAFEI